MAILTRTVLSVMTAFGLATSLGLSTPSFAADAEVPLVAAGTILATVAQPSLALDADTFTPDDSTTFVDAADDDAAVPPATLALLVAGQETADTVDEEQRCLAASVYFEAKGEPLAGQLAVAETVLNRAQSGRFASSICGVVRQPGQFSFVKGGRVPQVDRDSRAWATAVAIARVAQGELWRDVAPNALYFHAARVRPGFSGKRVAQLGNHVFYR